MKLCFSSLILVFSFLSCTNNNSKNQDHPAYHNPTVAPLTDSINLSPHNAALLYERCIALSKLNEDSLALEDVLNAIHIDSTNTDYLNAAAYLYINLNQPEKAVSYFKKSCQIKPQNVTNHIELARTYMMTGQNDEAQKIITNILNEAPNYPPALLAAAQLKAAQHDTLNAIKQAESLVKIEPQYYEASMQLADWYSGLSDTKAVAQYQNTFLIDTTDATPLFEIGIFYKRKKEWEAAKAAFTKCALIDNDFSFAYVNTGEILIQQDSFQKAIRILDLAIKTKPNNADAWFLKGNAYKKTGKNDSAKYHYNQAATFGYNAQEIKKALSEIK